MKKLIFILLFFVANGLFGQNGKILSQEIYTLNEEQINSIEQSEEVRELLEEVNFYKITYLSDGLQVKGYMSAPKAEGQYPCLIYNRGGGGDFGKIEDLNFAAFNTARITKAGYVVVASQYRGNDGGEGKDQYGGEEINDVLNLVPLLANVEKADTSRIGIYGVSRGGMMTYLALKNTDQFKAAIVLSGPVDVLAEMDFRPDMEGWMPNYIDNFAENREEELKKRSATYWADELSRNTPILILHSSEDDRVSPDPLFPFAQNLIKQNVPYRLKVYEGGDHNIREHKEDVLQEIIAWLNKYVRDGELWPDLYRGIESIGIVGSASPKGWNQSVELQKDTENEGVWALEIALETGDIKFRTNNSWDVTWGGFGFPKGRLFLKGANIHVNKGLYRIVLNLSDKSYFFEELD